ncbi:MAG TPA: response regulator [Pyrinomonadaceae bacterium]|nr:response regulator [Pyrinomonadaceae bacterium]
MQGHSVSLMPGLHSYSQLPPHPTRFFLSQEQNDIPNARGTSGTSSQANLPKPTALVVDDVADVTEMLAVFLSLAGYEVVTAHSAEQAIDEARSRQFDVVISDIGMPQMNGYELAESLRTIIGYEKVPLVAVTGFSMYDDRERSLRSGFNAHLTKPIDPNVLFQLIERLRG